MTDNAEISVSLDGGPSIPIARCEGTVCSFVATLRELADRYETRLHDRRTFHAMTRDLDDELGGEVA